MDWIIFDTKTIGLHSPIYTVEIAPQKMRGLGEIEEPLVAQI